MNEALRNIAMEFISSESPDEVEIFRTFQDALSLHEIKIDAGAEQKGEYFGLEEPLVSQVVVVILAYIGKEALDASKVITYGLLNDYLKEKKSQLTELEIKLHGKCTVLPKLEEFVKSRSTAK